MSLENTGDHSGELLMHDFSNRLLFIHLLFSNATLHWENEGIMSVEVNYIY